MRPVQRKGLFVCLAALCLASPADAATTIKVSPQAVDVTLFFNGVTVDVTGTVPQGEKVVVLCEGQPQKLEMKKKGKVWGVLWMNTDEVTFDGLPSLYLASSSAPLAELAKPATLAQLGVGYKALSTKIGEEADQQSFAELLKLKEKEGLFVQQEGQLKLSPKGEAQQLHAQCQVPARTPMGDYKVEVFGFKDGQGELLAQSSFKLQKVGAAHFITSLAESRGLLYGIASVIIALVIGILVGLIFGLKGKAH